MARFFSMSYKNHNGSGLENDPRYKALQAIKKSCYETYDNHSKFLYAVQEDEETIYCPKTFDGIACWGETPAGVTAYQKCPDTITGFNPNRLAYKTCEKDGFWFSRYNEARAWTDYTSCVDTKDLVHLYKIGYAISIIAFLISLFIFCYSKTPRCIRIRINMNLLAVLLFDSVMWIWYKMITNNTDTLDKNTVSCETLHLINSYTIVATYTWMFMGGLYLYLSSVVSFNEELKMYIKWFYLFMAFYLLLLIYGVGRYNSENAMRCWIDNSGLYWVIIMPVIITVLILLCNTIGRRRAHTRDHMV